MARRKPKLVFTQPITSIKENDAGDSDVIATEDVGDVIIKLIGGSRNGRYYTSHTPPRAFLALPRYINKAIAFYEYYVYSDAVKEGKAKSKSKRHDVAVYQHHKDCLAGSRIFVMKEDNLSHGMNPEYDLTERI